MKKITLLGIVALLVFGNCSSKTYTTDPLPKLTLPDFTTEGKNTIGCIIDGNIWVPGGVVPGKNTLLSGGAGMIPLHFTFYKYRKYETYVRLPTFYVSSLMSYTNVYRTLNFSVINTSLPSIGRFPITEIYYSSEFGGGSYIDKLNPPMVNFIKFDTIARIISGRFEGVIYQDTSKTKPMKITDGRFDIRYFD